MRITMANMMDLKEGDILIYKSELTGTENVGKVVRDPEWQGNLRVGGCSVKYIIENSSEVYKAE